MTPLCHSLKRTVCELKHRDKEQLVNSGLQMIKTYGLLRIFNNPKYCPFNPKCKCNLFAELNCSFQMVLQILLLYHPSYPVLPGLASKSIINVSMGLDLYHFEPCLWSTLPPSSCDLFKIEGIDGGGWGSKCWPRNDSKRRHISPLPRNIIPVTNQKNLGSSSKEDSKFMPKATPRIPKREMENVPIVSWRFKRIITLRWLSKLIKMMLSESSINTFSSRAALARSSACR